MPKGWEVVTGEAYAADLLSRDEGWEPVEGGVRRRLSYPAAIMTPSKTKGGSRLRAMGCEAGMTEVAWRLSPWKPGA